MSVRMSSIHFMYNYKNALNRTYAKQQRLFEQADGQKIHRGSDDPVAYANLMRYEFTQNENDTYTSNVHTANSWMKNSDSIINNMADNISTISIKANQAANAYLSETDSKSIAKEMYARIEEMISDANYQLGDRFLFAGQKDTTQPYTMTKDNVERGIAKNLDAKQAEFFKGTRGNVNTELYQMLSLTGDDGNTYYLDNQSGFLYTQDFVDEGYKTLIGSGKSYITEVDASEYAAADLRMSESEAVSTIQSASASDIAAVLNGTSTNNDLKRALRRIKDSTDSDTQITQLANSIAGSSESDIKAAVKKGTDFPSFMVSDYFTNQGVINETGEAGISVTIGETAVNLNFDTIQQHVVTYTGDDKYISMVKLNGATDTRSDIVNVTGQDLFGCDIFDDEYSGNEKSGTAMMNNLITVYNKTDGCDSHWLSSDGITLADVAHSTLIVAQTTLGARMQLYGNVEEMLDNQSTILTGDVTDLSGTDVADLATKLTELTTVYNLALSLGGRVLPQSLADYL